MPLPEGEIERVLAIAAHPDDIDFGASGTIAGFVRAGALASTFSDQDDWLAVLDQLLDQPPARWPRSLYPVRFGVSGNQQVARALGLEPIDPNAAAKALAEGEPTP